VVVLVVRNLFGQLLDPWGGEINPLRASGGALGAEAGDIIGGQSLTGDAGEIIFRFEVFEVEREVEDFDVERRVWGGCGAGFRGRAHSGGDGADRSGADSGAT